MPPANIACNKEWRVSPRPPARAATPSRGNRGRGSWSLRENTVAGPPPRHGGPSYYYRRDAPRGYYPAANSSHPHVRSPEPASRPASTRRPPSPGPALSSSGLLASSRQSSAGSQGTYSSGGAPLRSEKDREAGERSEWGVNARGAGIGGPVSIVVLGRVGAQVREGECADLGSAGCAWGCGKGRKQRDSMMEGLLQGRK